MLAALRAVGLQVGDVTIPDEFGWQGDPSKGGSEFIPFCTVTPMPASRSQGSLANAESEWQLPYTITSYGVDRNQVEDVADTARSALGSVRRVTITMRDGETKWKWQQTTSAGIGGVGYTDQLKPTAYSQADSALVWVSKQL